MERLGSSNAMTFSCKYGTILVSYKTKVALYDPYTGTVYRTAKKWSSTTSKHISKFIDSVKANKIEQQEQEFFDEIQFTC